LRLHLNFPKSLTISAFVKPRLSWLEAFNESSASPGSIPGARSISVHSAWEWGEKLLC
jgi:hypothetical protein